MQRALSATGAGRRLPPRGRRYICVVGRFAIDVTACWRPQRVGMLTVAVELAKAIVAHKGSDEITLLCSRERPAALADLKCEAVMSPYRHEVALKTRWLPTIELQVYF